MPITDFDTQGTIGATVLPKRFDLVIYEGDTLKIIIHFKDSLNAAVDLTGFTGLCKIKDSTDTTVIMTPTVTVNAGGVTGAVLIYKQDTSAITEGDYLYDLELTDATGDKRTFIGGGVTVTKDVSN